MAAGDQDYTTGPTHIVVGNNNQTFNRESVMAEGAVERRKDYVEIDHKLELVWTAINDIKTTQNDLSLKIATYMTRQDSMCSNHNQLFTQLTESTEKINKILNGNGIPGLVAKVDTVEKAISDITEDRKEKKIQLMGLMVSVAILLMGWIGQGAIWVITHVKGS